MSEQHEDESPILREVRERSDLRWREERERKRRIDTIATAKERVVEAALAWRAAVQRPVAYGRACDALAEACTALLALERPAEQEEEK